MDIHQKIFIARWDFIASFQKVIHLLSVNYTQNF